MFRVLLYDQWKAVRQPLALVSIISFALPVLSVQNAAPHPVFGVRAHELLVTQAIWGTAYPLLAGALGLLLGVMAWTRDHRTDHVYALSLPLPRWKYALLKFGAGGVLVVPAVMTLGVGTGIAALAATVPEGLASYPVALTARFGLTSMMAFSIFFAISSGTSRTAGVVLGSLAVLVGGGVFLDVIGLGEHVIDPLFDLLFRPGSPFDSFGGRWMLIDV
jgi:hypothetical protein